MLEEETNDHSHDVNDMVVVSARLPSWLRSLLDDVIADHPDEAVDVSHCVSHAIIGYLEAWGYLVYGCPAMLDLKDRMRRERIDRLRNGNLVLIGD